MNLAVAIGAISLLFIGTAILVARRPILFRMGMRNMLRRKVRAAIVIIGLLVGTATVSSSLIIGDTLEYIFVEDVYERLDAIDEMLYNETGRGYFPFQADYFAQISSSLRQNDTPIDGIAPMIILTVSGLNTRSGVGKQGVILVGLDGGHEDGFGGFETASGRSVSISDLGEYEAIVNERTARDLEVEVGDTLVVYSSVQYNLTVRFIARNAGKADYEKEDNVFVRLETAQAVLGLPGYINAIKVSNEGGVEAGIALSEEVSADLEAAARNVGAPLIVNQLKKDGVDDAIEFSRDVTEIFLIMGTFAVIAGILLIINIFVMLAEERKSEMGVVRAIGMKRSHLTQTFLFEGMAYATLSALLGTLLGLGIGYVILLSFGQIFPVEGKLTLTFRFTPESLFLAFAAGLLITFSTVVIASWRVSRLNIVRAIRDLPEPPTAGLRWHHLVVSASAIIPGAYLALAGFLSSSGTMLLVGPPLIMIGFAVLLSRFKGGRVPFTSAGIGIVAWVLAPLGYIDRGADDIYILFIATGLLLVLGSILIVIFNSSVILKVLLLAGGKKGRPVLRTAISYPMGKKFRTAMTLSMFSLIIFTVTVIAMIESMEAEGLEDVVEVESGGFGIVASPYRYEPLYTFLPMLENSSLDMGHFAGISSLTLKTAFVTEPDGDTVNYLLFDTDSNFSSQNKYTFHSLVSHYFDEGGTRHEIESEADAWTAIQENSSLAIVDGNVLGGSQFVQAFGDLRVGLGDEVTAVAADGGLIRLRIIGILEQVLPFTTGLFMGEGALASSGFNLSTSMSAYFFKLDDQADASEVARQLESEFLSFGLVVIDIGSNIREVFEIANRVLLLMEGYLGIGLMVGIAGLGVITVRAVVERRQEIGTLRAIGFKRRMILNAFLGEITFIAVLGILIGVIMGILLSYDVWLIYFDPIVDFTIPWLHILGVVLFAYVASILATLSPARRASGIPPAEALRTRE